MTQGFRRGLISVPVCACAAAALVLPVQFTDLRAQVMVYPANGQSPDQTQRDRGECMGWATQQSGFDPTAPRGYSAGPPPPSSMATNPHPVGRGAVRGAAVGAVGGAIGGDAGKGAAIGAASGALIGGMRRRDQERQYAYEQQQYQQQQTAAVDQQQSAFNRAFATCLQGRGYTVG
jgi:Glycine-zipper domain